VTSKILSNCPVENNLLILPFSVCTPMLALSNTATLVSITGYSGLGVLRGYSIAHNKPVWKGIIIALFLLSSVGDALAVCLSLPCGGGPTLWRYKGSNISALASELIMPIMEGITLVALLVNTRRKFRDLNGGLEQPSASLVDICRQQSIAIFGLILIFGIIESVIYFYLSNFNLWELVFLQSITGTMLVILFCRLFLELREADSRPNGSLDNSNQLPWSSFKAAIRKVDAAIIDEFGDHSSYGQTPPSQGNVEPIAAPSQHRSRSPSIQAIEELIYESEEAPVSRGETSG